LPTCTTSRIFARLFLTSSLNVFKTLRSVVLEAAGGLAQTPNSLSTMSWCGPHFVSKPGQWRTDQLPSPDVSTHCRPLTCGPTDDTIPASSSRTAPILQRLQALDWMVSFFE
jgi:hypothetical protein